MAQQTKRHGVTLPTSTIQGREFYWVGIDAGTDIQTDYDTVGSNFQKLITAVQQVAEMHIIGIPSGNLVTIALSYNTTPDAAAYNAGTNGALYTAINGALGWSPTVYQERLRGFGFDSDY